MNSRFTLHPGLVETTRCPSWTHRSSEMSGREVVALIGFGAVAALLTSFLNLQLKLPGHAILKVVFPISMGLAFVPRHLSGSVMGASAIVVATLLKVTGTAGGSLGVGALTSLVVIGPVLDLVLQRVRTNRGIYFGLMLAGLCTNFAAFLVRGAFKWFGLEGLGKRPLAIWLSEAMVTYLLCGLAAGFISAFVFFSLRSRDNSPETAV